MTKRAKSDRIAFFLFIASIVCLAFAYGVIVGRHHIFPHAILRSAAQGFQDLRDWYKGTPPSYHIRVRDDYSAYAYRADQAFAGLNLVTRVTGDRRLRADILDMEGREIHSWDIDWFRIWPEADHLPKDERPQARPGTHVHGAVVMEDGDLVFNFERKGLIRLDREGNVVWRLAYQTHHSVHRHDDGHLWVCGQKAHETADARFPNRKPPFDEYTLLEVTPEGTIAEEWSVAELLEENDLTGLLYLGSLHNSRVYVTNDALHLNDVEPFPETLKEDFFGRGDILVSLRNINTVLVFNRQSRDIKFICTGWFVRQHDPDFVDGNRFSVFDNNNVIARAHDQQSRIVMVSARENTAELLYEGRDEAPFFTDIMGKHQWLPNGNVLITESRKGRAFEVTPEGKVVWGYVNGIGNGLVGQVDEVQRLPLGIGSLYTNNEASRPASP